MADIKVLASEEFCADDPRYAGGVEVLEVTADGNKTIGLCLHVGRKHVPLSRSRIAEVLKAIEAAGNEASRAYTKLIEELNQ